MQLTATATPAYLYAGDSSVIIATVTATDDNPVQGQNVTFSLAVNKSGGTLSDTSKKTDAAGNAVVSYTAGENDPAMRLDDVIEVKAAGYSYSVVITRNAVGGAAKRIISFTEDPETSLDGAIGPPNDNVIMKVKVGTEILNSWNGGDEAVPTISPAKGETVTFTIIEGKGVLTNPTAGTSGSPITAVTDTNGEAWILFTRPATGTGDTVVRAQILGSTNGGDAARIVYWTDDCFVNTCCGN